MYIYYIPCLEKYKNSQGLVTNIAFLEYWHIMQCFRNGIERWLRPSFEMCFYVSIYRNIIVQGKGKKGLRSIKDESNPPDIRN